MPFKPPIRYSLPRVENTMIAYGNFGSLPFTKPMLLIAAYAEWTPGDLDPNLFMLRCIQRGSGAVVWESSTGGIWTAAPLAPVSICFTVDGDTRNIDDSASATGRHDMALGKVPANAWIAPDEQVVLGDWNGVNINTLSNGILSFLEPWD